MLKCCSKCGNYKCIVTNITNTLLNVWWKYKYSFHMNAFPSLSVAESFFDRLNILWAMLNLICHWSHPVDIWRLLQLSSSWRPAKVPRFPFYLIRYMWQVAISELSASTYMQFMTSMVVCQRYGRIRWVFLWKLAIEISGDEGHCKRGWRLLIVLQGAWRILLWIGLVKLARYMRFVNDETTSNSDIKRDGSIWTYPKYTRQHNCLHCELFPWFL